MNTPHQQFPALIWPDDHHLLAAQGWLELGDHLEANEELERIRPHFRAHPQVLEARWHVYERAAKWDGCLEIANTLLKYAPDDPEPWLHRSFALHELKRTQEAYDLLRPALAKFPKVWTFPYNLACYCAQLGRLDECKEWYNQAMALDQRDRSTQADPRGSHHQPHERGVGVAGGAVTVHPALPEGPSPPRDVSLGCARDEPESVLHRQGLFAVS